MNTEDTQQTNMGKEKDLMEGGFAVVDRERLIAEETREITPWYKNILNLFVAPTKAMEETIMADPPKGLGVGFVIAAILGILCTIITYLNPLQKIFLMDTLRNSGIAEDQLASQYQLALISGSIGVIASVAVSALGTAVVLQIIRAICKDKGSFKKLFTIAIFSQIVSFVVACIDALLQMLINTKTSILSLAAVFPAETLTNNPLLQTLTSYISVTNIWSVIILIVGYKVMTQKTIRKAIIVVGIYELISILFTYGFLTLSNNMLQMA